MTGSTPDIHEGGVESELTQTQQQKVVYTDNQITRKLNNSLRDQPPVDPQELKINIKRIHETTTDQTQQEQAKREMDKEEDEGNGKEGGKGGQEGRGGQRQKQEEESQSSSAPTGWVPPQELKVKIIQEGSANRTRNYSVSQVETGSK
jgi:hypothetical protein